MTYTYKLARRLAISRHFAMLTILALLAACSGGDATAPDLSSDPSEVAADFKIIGRGRERKSSDTATVTVPEPTLQAISVSPGTTSLATGSTQTYAATGTMSDGTTAPSVSVVWTATGGTIDSTGRYAAGATAGTFHVIAKHSAGPADTAAVTLTAPAPAPAPEPAPAPAPTPTTSFTGIAMGGFHTPAANLGSTFSGFLRTVYLPNLKVTLDSARARKGRVVLAVPRSAMRNADKTFNLDMWRQEIDRYRTFDFQPYINDGTLLGMYVIDEPDCGGCWGGRTVPQATVDELARYVKAIWPSMVTFARVVPGWFLSYGAPRYLDAAWAQWEGRLHVPSYNMTPEQFRDKNVADAKALRLGLVFGLNTLDGGDGTSRINGTFFHDPNLLDEVYKDFVSGSYYRYQMSAAEVERVASVFAAAPYACAVLSWRWSPDYPTASYLTSTQLANIRAFDNRTDVKAAWAKAAQAAASRAPAPCRVR